MMALLWMKINPVILGWLVAVFVFLGGLIASEILLNTEHKPLSALFWPPTVRWVAWCVIGTVIGRLVRSWVQNKQR
jgi:hypothetical protein